MSKSLVFFPNYRSSNRERSDCLTIFQKLLTIKPFLIHVNWINLINFKIKAILNLYILLVNEMNTTMIKHLIMNDLVFCFAFILAETGFYFWKLKSFLRKLKKQSYIFLRIVVFYNSILPTCFSTVIKAIFSNNLIHLEIWTSVVPS